MKKLFLAAIFALSLTCMGFAQNGGLLQRGENKTDENREQTMFQHENREEKNNTPIGNGVLLLTAFGISYAIRKKNKN